MEWIQSAQAGDDTAYHHLVDQHRDAVFRLAYLILGDADDAEDAAQETFIRAHKNLHRFDATRPMRPWLLRIVTNLCRNKQRSAGRYWAAVRRFAQGAVDAHTDAETLSVQQAEAVALWQAVRQLKSTEQQVIYLRYFLDLSVDETAETLEIAPGTVKSRLHRALKQLKRVVELDYPILSEGREHNGQI